MRREFLPFHVPDISEAEIASVVETLTSGWLTSGPKVQEFERAFSDYIGAKQAVAVNSCTAALHLALEATGVGAGDEVLVPTMTFGATGEVVVHVGAKPVLVDCCPGDLNIDVSAAEQVITQKTKAIIPVHYAGHACEMDEVIALARKHGLIVIEDAAHALPTRYKGKRIGCIGDVTCFSFYATKTLTTGEGGMATTDRADLAERMRMMSLHGISKDAWKRYSAEGNWYYEILSPGFKYNMPDLAAALGLPQLARCDRLHDIRCRYAEIYQQELSALPEISVPPAKRLEDDAWHLYPIQLDLERLRITRDQVIRELNQRRIGTSVHFIPLHLHPFYRESYGYRRGDFPNATRAFERLISLPIYSRMSERDVRDVVTAVHEVVRESSI